MVLQLYKKNRLKASTLLKAKMQIAFWYFMLFGMLVSSVQAQVMQFPEKKDSIRGYNLKETIIQDNIRKLFYETAVPIQKLTTKDIERQNLVQLSDAVKQFSGTVVKDYGGIGGLKTVSVRSLGSQNTLVNYDGITISDCQNGQVDLGKFTLEKVEHVSLVNGQDDNILQTARAISLSSLLSIKTKQPLFEDKKPINLLLGSKIGSFGLFNPMFIIESRITNKVSLSVNVNWLQSKGNYPFTLQYGLRNDSTSRETRENSDVKSLGTEANVFVNFTERQKLAFKANYYQSERGLPGAVIFYSVNNSNQRFWDKTFFTQVNYTNELNALCSFRIDAKYSTVFTRYLDPYYLYTEDRKLDEEFLQNEYYFSGAFQYNPLKQLSFSWANDFYANTLNSNLNQYNNPVRYTWLSALNGKYENKRLQILASILSTFSKEHTHESDLEKMYNQLTPFSGISYKIFKKEDIRLRYFYKQNYRIANFNELYYNNVGNPNLRPEITHQQNLGITYTRSFGKYVPSLLFTIDGYYNNITDKIIAIPSQNLFVWSMQNLDKVTSTGLDVNFDINMYISSKMQLDLSGNYNYQLSTDVSNPMQKSYKKQIPYTPFHSGSVNVSLLNSWVDVNWGILYSGERYKRGDNKPDAKLDAYLDQNITLSKSIELAKIKLKLQAQVLNIFNKEYQVVSNYPMPGRNYRIGFTIDF